MPDQWISYDGGSNPFDTSLAEAQAESLQALQTTVGAALKATRATLAVAGAFTQEVNTALRSTLDTTVTALEDTVKDLFQNSASVAVHTNLEWNPDWKYEKLPTDPSDQRDFVNDGELPWLGRGMQSWLQDVAASAKDPSNAFRPLTDSDTSVGGFILLTGVTAGQDINNLRAMYDVFSFDLEFAENFETAKLESANAVQKALFRLGPAGFSDFMRSASGDIEVGELTGDFTPRRGAYPKWVTLSLASVIPGLGDLLLALREAGDLLQVPLQEAELLDRLLNTLEAKAAALDNLTEKVSGALSTLASLESLLGSINVIYLEAQPGGFKNFIERAANADGVPDFGERGIVSGTVIVGAFDDPANHLEALFELIGVKASTLASNTSTRAQNLADTYDDIF